MIEEILGENFTLQVVRPEINEINAGLHDNMTYEDIASEFPAEFALRDSDKLNYRYPEVR